MQSNRLPFRETYFARLTSDKETEILRHSHRKLDIHVAWEVLVSHWESPGSQYADLPA